MTQSSKPRVERANTYLVIPHNGGEVKFLDTIMGPDKYIDVADEIIREGLILPDASQTVSLLHEVYCSDEPNFVKSKEIKSVRRAFDTSNLVLFNRNFWTARSEKNPGVYVVKDPTGLGYDGLMDISHIEDELKGGTNEGDVRFSKDGRVAFAPYSSFESGNHKKGTLVKNGFVVANFGVEGARKLDDISKMFDVDPIIITRCTDYEQNTLDLIRYRSVRGFVTLYCSEKQLTVRIRADYDFSNCFAYGISSITPAQQNPVSTSSQTTVPAPAQTLTTPQTVTIP